MQHRPFLAVFATGFLLGLAARAGADGMFVWRNRVIDIREPEQKALIFHDAGWEELVLSVRFEGAAGDFGWLVPLPSRPEMTPAAGDVFGVLSRAMQNPFAMTGMYLHPPRIGNEASEAAVSATHRQVGIYDVTLLESPSGAALHSWLAAHGFVLPDGAPAVLDTYTAKGWILAALRIVPARIDSTVEAQLHDGEIQPIRFRFATPSPVFPLRISALGGHPSRVLLYLLSDHPLRPVATPGINWQVALAPFTRVKTFLPDDHRAIRNPFAKGEPNPSYLRDLVRSLENRHRTYWMTRCRATVATADMLDLAFEPLDPERALASSDPRERTEAASWLGMSGDPTAWIPLVDFLASQDIPPDDCEECYRDVNTRRGNLDLWSALCALGQLGEPAAAPELYRWSTCDNPLYQVDAIEALAHVDTTLACDAALSVLERVGLPQDRCARALYRTARKMIIAMGGPRLLPRLRRLLEQIGRQPPSLERRRYCIPFGDPRATAWSMAAACGDTAAQDSLETWTVRLATRWNRTLAVRDSLVCRPWIDFPDILEPLASVADLRGISGDSPAAFCVFVLLRDRPAVRDAILRRAAGHVGLTIYSRALLLWELSSPTPRDRMLLARMWKIARRSPRLVWVGCGTRLRPRGPWIAFDLDATAVAYASARSGMADTVLKWWLDIPWQEMALKDEMLAALVRLTGRHDFPAILYAQARELMRRVWNAGARTQAHQCYVVSATMSNGVPQPAWPAFHTSHRRDALERLFRANPREMFLLLEDTALAPIVRLDQLNKVWYQLLSIDPPRLNRILRSLGAELHDQVLYEGWQRIAGRVAKLEKETEQRRLSSRRDGITRVSSSKH